MENKGTFRDLIVWQKAITLATTVYETTRALPASEKFGLAAQMQRAAVSIPSNIAEGNARQKLGDCLHFLGIARGSLAEMETQVIIAGQLEMLSNTAVLLEQSQEVRRMLQALIESLRRKQNNAS
jgi:four helix bundle protein